MQDSSRTRPYWVPSKKTPSLTTDERLRISEVIREKISHFSLTYVWLIHRLSDDGMFTDKFEMSAVLSGMRTGPKADEILRRSNAILTEYELRMRN